MPHSWIRSAGFALVIATVLAGCGAAEPAPDCGQLRVDNAQVRPAHTGSREMLGYFNLHNTGSQPIAIEGITSADFGRVIFQNKSGNSTDQGARPMAPFTLEPDSTMIFEPGGREIALYSPTKAYRAGDTIGLTLTCGPEAARLDASATVHDEQGDLPAVDEAREAADRQRILEDGRDGGGVDATDDSRTAS